ncbi:MAG: L,D-transpeptidase family protein [Anaerolineales bacterium]|nr:L,D-transpeptidase family protein [Anaerolineales bacterium]
MSYYAPQPMQSPQVLRRKLPGEPSQKRARANPVAQTISPSTSRASPFMVLSLIAMIALVGLMALALLGVWGIYAYYQSNGRILPGVRVGDINLEGMTPAQAAITLDLAWNQETRLLVVNGPKSQSVSPAQLGLSIDALKTAQQAHEIGRVGSILAKLAQMTLTFQDGWQIIPVVKLEVEVARQELQNLAPTLSQSPRDASLRVENGQIFPVEGELGYTVNIEETLNLLKETPEIVFASGILNTTPQPVIPQINDVSAALAEAQQLLDRPFILQAYDPIVNEQRQWPVPREILASWLMVETDQEGPRLTLDEARLTAYLPALSAELGAGRSLEPVEGSQIAEALRQGIPVTLNIKYSPTTYVVQQGDTLLKIGWKLGFPYWIIQAANPSVNPDSLPAGAELVIPAKTDLLPLPIVPNKRIVISISQQRLRAYQDGSLLSKHIISTGIDRSPTQPGIFQVQTHDPNAYASVWDLYMPHFLGIYEAWPGFMNGIHGLPTLSNGQRLWANVLGSPASYGCIILDLQTAEWLYGWAENGVVVEITP